MSFLWRLTVAAAPPTVTDGAAYAAMGKKLFEERKTRMASYAERFRAAFVADVKTLMAQKIQQEPWETSFVIKANEVVNNSALTSHKIFVIVCDRTKKVLTSDEAWELLRALREAAVNQDYVVRIDDSEGTATVDFTTIALAPECEDTPPPLINLEESTAKVQTAPALLEDVD